ncbi:MAG: conjugal transfer protein (TraA-like protein) [Acidimicrobiales bacterium]|nr:conjugal transfer protein (TraA-like protein) [Acidimicrobiales bacterium]
MRVTTLKASGDRLAGLVGYYAGLAEDRERPGPGRGPVDYYLDPDEPPGRWWGSGRDALGLEEQVQGDQLRALLAGHHPGTGHWLGRSFGDRSARGFDATFSAPKSVSALWALTPDPWVRAEVLAAHDAAVSAALGWFEQHGAVTRRGRDGVDQVDALGITAALFRQHTSRSMDPQLHTHAVISSKVQDSTGMWLALDARFLKYQQRTIGWIYDAALRSELTARLGVEWEAVGNGPVDLACIPEEVRSLFSRRSRDVDRKLTSLLERWQAEHDGDDPDPLTIASLERKAVLASRPSKAHGVDASELHGLWVADAASIGFRPHELTAAGIRRYELAPKTDPWPVIDEAIRRVSDESSTWLPADLARHIATLLPPEATRSAEDLADLVDHLVVVAVDRCLDISPVPDSDVRRRDGRPIAEHVTDHRVTTAAIVEQEEDLHRWAGASLDPEPLPTEHPQRAAAGAIAGDRELVVVVGPAGTGKTTTIAAGVAELQRQGRGVVGLAPSGKATDVLATEARCPSLTLASFLQYHDDERRRPWQRGTTVILDEAAMTRTDDLHRLVDLARRHQWRLVAVGDPAQLPAVGRGGVFSHWCDTLPHHELVTPRRFTERWEAAASIALRAGDADAAEHYADHDRLHTVHPKLLAQRLALEVASRELQGQTVAITTVSVETAKAINQAIQRQRGPAVGASVDLADGTVAQVGDRIATRRNDRSLETTAGMSVRNRHTWMVRSVGQDGSLTVTDDERGSVRLPGHYVAQHVKLGWAVTGYGNQGDTTDVAYAVVEPGTNRSHLYVAMTRGRAANHAWIPDPTGTLDPTDALSEVTARTPNHASALATHAQLVANERARAAGARPAAERSVAPEIEPPGLWR